MPRGDIALRHSRFDDDAFRRMFDELDYQRACQAYVWSTPLVSITSWRDAHTSSDGPTEAALTKAWKPGDCVKMK